MKVNKDAQFNDKIFIGAKSLCSTFLLSKKGGLQLKSDAAGYILRVSPGFNVTPNHILVCPNERKGASKLSLHEIKNADDTKLAKYTKPQLKDLTKKEFIALSGLYYDHALSPLANDGENAPGSLVMIINNGKEAGQNVYHSHWHRLDFKDPLPVRLETLIVRAEKTYFHDNKGRITALPDEFKDVETRLMPDFPTSGEEHKVAVQKTSLSNLDLGKIKAGHYKLRLKQYEPLEKNGLPTRKDFLELMEGVYQFDKTLHGHFNAKATSIFAEFNLQSPKDGPVIHIVPYSQKAPARAGGAVYYLRDELLRYNQNRDMFRPPKPL